MLTRLALSLFLVVLSLSCTSSGGRTNDAVNVAPTVEPETGANTPRPGRPMPTEPPVVNVEEEKRLDAITEQFRVPSKDFEKIDFKNWTYPYRFSYDNKSISARLKDGRYEYETEPSGGGWFNFEDAFYVDLTGDGRTEAVVILWHVSCGGSCDGGAALLYVFSAAGNKPSPLWHFETGSVGYGCGLKSLQIAEQKISLQVFGDCTVTKNELELNDNSSGMSKFWVKDTTTLIFHFADGFRLENREVTRVPERSVLNYPAFISVQE